jgi:Protein of unknown function (DUF3500)
MNARVLCSAILLSFILARSAAGGPPAEEMSKAAKQFVTALTPEQRTKAIYAFTSDERFNWHFVSKPRKGLPFKEMTLPQQELARALLRAGLSKQGFIKATNIMLVIEQVLRELEGGATRRDPGLYYFTIFGDTDQSPWGWRVEGHHLALNLVVGTNDVVSVTPTFFGSNPAEVPQGPHKGLRNLAGEEDLGRQLATSLSKEQRSTGLIAADAPSDIITGNSRKAKPIEPFGIPASKLSKSQQEVLFSLIREYVFRFRNEVAEQDFRKIRNAGFEKIYFAWAGPLERGKGHYYCIQGPTFLMEYDNTQDNANHIHTVWRDFENDFGEDLLRSHYDQMPHTK